MPTTMQEWTSVLKGVFPEIAADPNEDIRPMVYVGGGYMNAALNTERLLKKARAELGRVDFDTLVGRGLSGALAAPLIAHDMGKQFLVLRKPGDGSHSNAKGEGYLGKRWIFVDDFIATGDTFHEVKATVEDIAKRNRFTTLHVGDFLYESDGFVPRYSPRLFDPESPNRLYGFAAADMLRRERTEKYSDLLSY